ncbi:hypothetical protein ABKN59_009039 [Abortiporus biennis]
MVDWKSTAELEVEQDSFTKLMHCLAGVYFFEYLTSLDFDWAFISGRKKFKWPMIFYFLGRYALLATLIGILVSLDSKKEINCQALYTFNQFGGNTAMGSASINLAIRTMAIWNRNLYVVVPLVVIILGHWALLLQGILLSAEWIPGVGCYITKTDNRILAATFVYTMSFDLIVLVLSAWNLLFMAGRSQTSTLLFKDGLIYFIIAFLSNSIAMVFMLTNLSPVMSIIFNVPAVVSSTIVASRVVRRLSKFVECGPKAITTSQIGSFFHRRTAQSALPPLTFAAPKSMEDIHIEMETCTHSDEDIANLGKISSKISVDPEAQDQSDLGHSEEETS